MAPLPIRVPVSPPIVIVDPADVVRSGGGLKCQCLVVKAILVFEFRAECVGDLAFVEVYTRRQDSSYGVGSTSEGIPVQNLDQAPSRENRPSWIAHVVHLEECDAALGGYAGPLHIRIDPPAPLDGRCGRQKG